jgi:multiple sugar transport system substrate-binding protein
MKTGWNLAQDFVNMFLGFGGSSSMPTEHADGQLRGRGEGAGNHEGADRVHGPRIPGLRLTYVQQQFQQGKIAMANLWASRAGAMDDEAESQVVGLVNAPPRRSRWRAVAPATTLWWDGIVIAKNITDEEAEAAFRVAMEGSTPRW